MGEWISVALYIVWACAFVVAGIVELATLILDAFAEKTGLVYPSLTRGSVAIRLFLGWTCFSAAIGLVSLALWLAPR